MRRYNLFRKALLEPGEDYTLEIVDFLPQKF